MRRKTIVEGAVLFPLKNKFKHLQIAKILLVLLFLAYIY